MRNIGLDAIFKHFDKHDWDVTMTEPGGWDADTTDKPILMCDWNPIPSAMYDYLENFYQLEWDDEGGSCCNCNKYVRTSPTSYGWVPNYIFSDGNGYICRECVEDNPDELIEEFKDCGYVQPKACPEWGKELLEKAGWNQLERENVDDCDSYESGWYYGQNDDPAEQVKNLEKHFPNHSYIFAIDSTGQFDVHWSIWVKER